MTHIFISYSHKDTAYVEKLEKKLIEEGFDVWVDHRIDYGSRWTQEIEHAIDNCAAYIVVMSKNSSDSQWVQREVIHAEKRRKPFFPLLLKGETWFSLGNIQFVDVTGGKLPPKDYYEDIAAFVPRKSNASSVGAGTKSAPTPLPDKKNTLLIGGIALVFSLLVAGGFLLKKSLSAPKPPVGEVIETFTPEPVITETAEPTKIPPTKTLPPPAPTEVSLAPPADAQLGENWTRPTDGMLMSYIPAGEFQMGSEDGENDEQPVHTVNLDAFWMDQTEVTNAMYAECVFNGRCENLSNPVYLDDAAYADYPVVYVSWKDAKNYCEIVGGRLPTEAEWEKAARGGLEGKKYPWGDEAPACNLGVTNGAKFDDEQSCSNTGAEPVTSFLSNEYGLYDMAGNVWEWVGDWYGQEYYASSPTQNPRGPASGQYRVLRGGSWNDTGNNLRSANRNGNSPDNALPFSGFRCVHSSSE